jgi:lactate racemase
LKVGSIAKQFSLIVVTLPENKVFIEKAGMIPATTLAEAVQIAEEKLNRKDYTISVMSHGANTVPIFE